MLVRRVNGRGVVGWAEGPNRLQASHLWGVPPHEGL
jgi:hypothetical protein